MLPPADTVPTQGAPSPVQLVTVRHVVTKVASGHARARLSASGAVVQTQHLVRLRSIDGEGLGDELSVIWEIGPGTQLHERASLPDPARRALGRGRVRRRPYAAGALPQRHHH